MQLTKIQLRKMSRDLGAQGPAVGLLFRQSLRSYLLLNGILGGTGNLSETGRFPERSQTGDGLMSCLPPLNSLHLDIHSSRTRFASRPNLGTESMLKTQRLVASAALLLVASPAIASDGLLTLVVGIPLLVAAAAVLVLMLILRPGKFSRTVSAVLFVPVFLYSLYVSIDALTLFRDIGSENSMIGFAFFGLLVLACFFFYLIVSRRPIKD